MRDPSKYGAAVKLRKAAFWYLRTYFYLIQHESDLRIAQESAASGAQQVCYDDPLSIIDHACVVQASGSTCSNYEYCCETDAPVVSRWHIENLTCSS